MLNLTNPNTALTRLRRGVVRKPLPHPVQSIYRLSVFNEEVNAVGRSKHHCTEPGNLSAAVQASFSAATRELERVLSPLREKTTLGSTRGNPWEDVFREAFLKELSLTLGYRQYYLQPKVQDLLGTNGFLNVNSPIKWEEGRTGEEERGPYFPAAWRRHPV